MRNLVLSLIAAGLCLPAAALAEPKTRTVTVDTPNYEGTRTVTRDREAGSVSRDTEVTRLSDGATRTRNYDRQRTANGVTASGATTRFNGQTRNFDYTRTRGEGGYTADGNVTRFNGQSYDYHAAGRRTPNGFVRRQGLRNGDGELVAGRRVAVRQGPNGGIARRSFGFRRR